MFQAARWCVLLFPPMAPGLAWRICAALQLRRAVEHGALKKRGGFVPLVAWRIIPDVSGFLSMQHG